MKYRISTAIKTASLGLSLLFTLPSSAEQITLDEATLASLDKLTTYQALDHKLKVIEKWSYKNLQTGPLIINGDNGGIINIDIPLPPYLPVNHGVCGGEPTTIRNAVTCTVQDNLGGNTDASKIGFSTQGRELLAAQLGNPQGKRVLIITQQHGNEPAATEAALRTLVKLGFSPSQSVHHILEKLNILMILRANPDGGEPDAANCAMLPATGSVLTQDCAMIRENVNPAAGGGFLANSEQGFGGVVGQGYDLNRYHFVTLTDAIRPVETQAMVATALAFQPEIVLDLHGDLHKTDCVIDYTSINPGQVLGQLPTAECYQPDLSEDMRLISPFADAVFSPIAENLVQSLAVDVMTKVDEKFEGSVGRFSQIQLSANNLGAGAAANYQYIGTAHAGWETANFSKQLGAAVVAVENYQPVISVSAGLPDPSHLDKQIKINQTALLTALKSLAQYTDEVPTDGKGFCDFPLASGLLTELPLQQWGPLATNGEVTIPMSPLLGIPLITSGNCP